MVSRDPKAWASTASGRIWAVAGAARTVSAIVEPPANNIDRNMNPPDSAAPCCWFGTETQADAWPCLRPLLGGAHGPAPASRMGAARGGVDRLPERSRAVAGRLEEGGARGRGVRGG